MVLMGSFEEGRVCLRKNMEMTRENIGGEEKKWRWRVRTWIMGMMGVAWR
jgi:hypothetical protein